MKIDHEFLKKILDFFESADKPTITLVDFENNAFLDDEHCFVFHMQILCDRKLVQREDGEAGFGIVDSNRGEYGWIAVPLRLTADGHDFLEALRNDEVWAKLKTDFKDASIGTLWSVSKQLLEGYLKKKVESLIVI
ncbi:DUF2513 domain-containing protein [Thiothrix nivea]|uniref:DUF2513 domain-containing protein n=1 Tax=Thiothrix nivea (strain ATCC 35100 / DSM 5205 / JP2) TaxID=870187 RepID=A0A656HIG3_THINJ|nr:DUF2513 domain-containing protein [Thiothrix nivea]EIJ35286.1 Protein of unknown function DUF2513 [Thiothrix nivea DSM 5205]